MNVTFEIQRRCYEILAAGLSCPVYDYVPPTAAMPYAEIGDDIVTDLSDKTDDQFSIILTIHCWSATRGRKEVRNMTMQVRDLLHDNALAADGLSLLARCQQIQTFRDPDGVTMHGVVSFRVMASPQ
jgi:hypothetical protein